MDINGLKPFGMPKVEEKKQKRLTQMSKTSG